MARAARLGKEGGDASTSGVSSKPQPRKSPASGDSTGLPLLQTRLEGVADAWAGEMRARARRLTEVKSPGAAAPELIHDLRVYMRRLSALSDLMPCKERGGAIRRMLRKEVAWAMQPLSRARDWDVFVIEMLPRLCNADSDLDRVAATKRAAARSDIVHSEMYAHLRSERFQGVLRLFRERDEDMRVATAERRSKVLFGRIHRKLEGWEKSIRDRLAGPAMRGARTQHRMRIKIKRLRYASEALLQLASSRKLDRFVRSLGQLQGKLGDIQDLRTASQLGGEVSVSLSTGRLTGRKAEKVCARLLRKAEAELRVASRSFVRKPSFWADSRQGRVVRRLVCGKVLSSGVRA
ncbi:CHAD domain-containing protein [Achromobacter sp. Bel]|uniref:CHAD domain-containing protein n=1 Tax=Achromobacter sp. Bel TaxID=2727415 RepID=UPI00145D8EF7|nr:CHAD domain-containing protein [Achromobacter sp. Bel]NMK46471.1 CHAD domain-containing protein [Achromobacter sp. Bel]